MPRLAYSRFRLQPFLISLLALGAALSAQSPAHSRFFIIDYHTFIGNPSSTLDFTEAALAAQLDRMAAMGYRFVRLEDALAGRISGANNIVLTIDDGNHSVYPAVKHVLEPRGIPAFLFIYPGIIGSRRFAMTPAQVNELAAAGYGIGAHGWFHEYMTSKAWAKDRNKVMLEVTRSRPGLQRITGAAPDCFAFPFGVGSPEATAELIKAGYQWIFTADTKVVPLDPADPAFDKTAIPRTLMFSWYLPQFWKALEKQFDPAG